MFKKESELYKPLQNWVEEQGCQVNEKWKNIGFYKCHVDVMGVKNSGNKFYDDIEILAVEAKLGGNFASLGQADNYKDFAHKVYFATANKNIGEQLREDVLRKGLGLLQVDQDTGEVKEILNAIPATPRNEAQMFALLDRLGIFKCPFCGGYFKKSSNMIELKRVQQFNKKRQSVKRWLCVECQKFLRLDKRYAQKQELKNAQDKIEKRTDRLEDRRENNDKWLRRHFENKIKLHRKWFTDHYKKIKELQKKV